ncbi:CPBP family intramembrane metalloprotease domain-containing protein [Brevibacterium sp. CCUG 69071]|nr:CPBP family intramembrane metalloprotease domain-containing protein [Brevibacterium sp. CCUG 69071]
MPVNSPAEVAQADTSQVDAKRRPLAVVPSRVPWLPVGVFVAVAVGLAWLVCLPLWLSGEGLSNLALVQISGGAMMITPLVATIVALVIQRVRAKRAHRTDTAGADAAAGRSLPSVPRYLGLWPLRPFARVIGVTLGAVLGIYVIVVAGYFLSAAFGWVQLDLTGLSGFKAQLATIPGLDTLPLIASLLIYLALIVIQTVVTAFLAFGEEIGWRGWLLTSLRPLGTWPALLIVGVIWGLWHAPLILLGYNFSRPDITGLAFMIGGCMMLGILFGWLRLRTGSVWPAVFAHAGLNASSGLLLALFFDAAAPMPDMALVATLGVAGWIVSAIVIGLLLATGQFRRQPDLGIKVKPARLNPSEPEPVPERADA